MPRRYSIRHSRRVQHGGEFNSDALSELFAEWGITLLDIAKKYTPITENKDPGLSVYTKDDLLKMSNELIDSVIRPEKRENISKGINGILNYVMDGTIDSDKIPQRGGGGMGGPNGAGENSTDPTTKKLLAQYEEQIAKIDANAKSLMDELKSLTDVNAAKAKEAEIWECTVQLHALQQEKENIKKGGCKLQPAELEAMGNNSSSINSCVSVLHRATASVASSYTGQVCNAITLPNPPSNTSSFLRDLAKNSGYLATGITVIKVVLPYVCNLSENTTTNISLVGTYASITSGCTYLMLVALRLSEGDTPKDVTGFLGNANVHSLVGSVIGKMNGSVIPALDLGKASVEIPFIPKVVSAKWSTVINFIRNDGHILSAARFIGSAARFIGSAGQYLGSAIASIEPMNFGPYNSNNNNKKNKSNNKKRKTRKYRSRM